MARGFALVYFTDENALGLGKLLRRSGRTDVLFPGHDELPEVPLGCNDIDWMRLAGNRGFIVITRDKRIRTRPAELLAYREFGIRSVWIGAKQNLSPADQFAMFQRYEARLRREIVKRGPGPWALAMSVSGLRPLSIKSPE